MAESVPVRCPACRREHMYAAPTFPCACGAPVSPPLVRGAAAVPITHRTWSDDWVTARCPTCGRQDQWPQPELGCACGTVLRIAVRSVAASGPQAPADPPSHIPLPPTAPAPRPAFHPVTIRTARDAVTAAALYLKWLGYRDVRYAEPRSGTGAVVALHAPGLIARVEPSTRQVEQRDVETLWLSALAESAVPVYFSLAGYTEEGRGHADTLAVPLFVLDLTGAPLPVNSPADELVTTGGGE